VIPMQFTYQHRVRLSSNTSNRLKKTYSQSKHNQNVINRQYGIQLCDYCNSHKIIIKLDLFECINKLSSTFLDDSAVRLADTVQPAALNDLSLAAVNAGMANSCRANARSCGNCVCFFNQASIS